MSSAAENGEQKIVGVGIVFDDAAKGLVIESLVPGGGAEVCGDVLPGDELLTVDGKDVTGEKAAAIAKQVAGPVGSTVFFTLRRRAAEAAVSEKEGAGKGEDGWEIKAVEIVRIEFSIDDQHYVPWTEVVDAAKAPLGKGWFAGVAPLQGSIMKQMKIMQTSVQTSVQTSALFENISSKANMVRQSATSAVLPVLKTMQPSLLPASDPRPKDYCMHLYTHPDKYVILPPTSPPVLPGESARQALVVDRASMAVQWVSVEDAEEVIRGKAKMDILGVLGIAQLQHASYLLVITGRQVVGVMPHGLVYRVTSTSMRVLGAGSKSAGPLELSNRGIELKLLEELLATYSMFMSYDFDITHTHQRLAERGVAPWAVAQCSNTGDGTQRLLGCASPQHAIKIEYSDREERFVWNSKALRAMQPDAAAWHSGSLVPVVTGFVSMEEVTGAQGSTAAMALIARREWHRCGYRYLSRGIDDCGNVSNAVETEQVFFVPRVSHVSLASLASPGAAKGAASSTSEGKGASSETSQDASPGQQPPTTKDTCVPPTTQDTRPAGVGGTLFGGTFAPSAAAVPSVPPPPTPPACAACGVTSFVIYRGSIPLKWAEGEQLMTLKPKPELELTKDAVHLEPLRKHLEALHHSYGALAFLSLIEHKEWSHERPMGQVFERVLQGAAEGPEAYCRSLRFIPFDFHSVCGKLAFRNLPLLVNECQEALKEHGLFARDTRLPCAPAMREHAGNCSSGAAGDSDRQGGRVDRQQQGVFRVNCVDCLDRTNVAQSVLAFRMALNQLHALSLCTGEDVEACLAAVSSETPLPFAWADALDKKFKCMWADHGDAISLQYSGSCALKGDLTRTGKRTVRGLLQDGVSSIKRCVQNNFADVHRQQVIECFHGVAVMQQPPPQSQSAAPAQVSFPDLKPQAAPAHPAAAPVAPVAPVAPSPTNLLN